VKLSGWGKLFGGIYGLARRDRKLRIVLLIWLLVIFGMIAVFAAVLGPLQPFVYTLL